MRVLLAVLVVLAVAEAACRTSREDPKDTQRVEHRVNHCSKPDFATKYESAAFG
jgi:hypothetical protein